MQIDFKDFQTYSTKVLPAQISGYIIQGPKGINSPDFQAALNKKDDDKYNNISSGIDSIIMNAEISARPPIKLSDPDKIRAYMLAQDAIIQKLPDVAMGEPNVKKSEKLEQIGTRISNVNRFVSQALDFAEGLGLENKYSPPTNPSTADDVKQFRDSVIEKSKDLVKGKFSYKDILHMEAGPNTRTALVINEFRKEISKGVNNQVMNYLDGKDNTALKNLASKCSCAVLMDFAESNNYNYYDLLKIMAQEEKLKPAMELPKSFRKIDKEQDKDKSAAIDIPVGRSPNDVLAEMAQSPLNMTGQSGNKKLVQV